MWPLELVDRRDPEQMAMLFKLLSRLPHLIVYCPEVANNKSYSCVVYVVAILEKHRNGD